MTLAIERLDLSTADESAISASTRRSALPDASIRRTAADIVGEIRDNGEAALNDYSLRFGGALADGTYRVPTETIDASLSLIDASLLDALDRAIWNVRSCHHPQIPKGTTTVQGTGVTVERVWTPLSRVGVYVPGGRAVYPSSLIMGVVPALIAGVADIAVATPARTDGTIDPIVLAAAAKLGITTIYAMGGAQAIGALAFGTDSVKRVEKIVGPGGPWVTAAKIAVYGECGVDLPAGPSEAVIVADHTTNPVFAAADVMCQAEHGEESAVVIIATDTQIADEILAEIERQLPLLERSDIIVKALENEGRIVIAPTTREALSYANAWAPEHLSIHTENARHDAGSVPNAGSVFIGEWTPEAAGDYATGANHILPTGGLANAYGPLGVENFGSWRQIQTLTEDGLASLAPTITALATAEGLTAHAHAIDIRLNSAQFDGAPDTPRRTPA